MRIWNIMKHRGKAPLLILLLGTAIMLLMSLSCGPIELGADTGFTINVNECQPFSMQFSASSTTCPSPVLFYWVIGTLPPYATLDEDTGLLTGCPQVGDPSASFIVGVSEFSPPACGPYFDMQAVTINVIPAAPVCDMVIEPTFYPVAWEGLLFSMPLSVTGGVGPFEWSAAGLPAGLAVTDNVNGVISGIPGPGTCGVYTATATVTDLGTCCCPPVNRDFILYVDCWANYTAFFYYTTACDFGVQIGPGLVQGQANVMIDGSLEATLGGGQSAAFTSIPCESHVVVVDQVVQSSDPNTRFAVVGSNSKVVTDIDNLAYFDYIPEFYINTATNPAGVAQPQGAGFYAAGSYFSGSTPGTVESTTQQGFKYVFREWQLPDGSKNPNRDLVFPVNQTGTAIAEYDTFCLLTLKSEYPPIEERSWERQGSTATWDLSLHAVPMESPFWAFLGGSLSPVNSSGSQLMTGPSTVEIQWRANYTGPIIAIIIVLMVIGGLCYVGLRFSKKPAAQPATETAPKEDPSKAKKKTARKRTPK